MPDFLSLASDVFAAAAEAYEMKAFPSFKFRSAVSKLDAAIAETAAEHGWAHAEVKALAGRTVQTACDAIDVLTKDLQIERRTS
jgi:hypothetical protein